MTQKKKDKVKVAIESGEVKTKIHMAEAIVASVREPLLVLDTGLHVVMANSVFYSTFQVAPEASIGKLIYDLGNCQWEIPELHKLLEEILTQNTVFNDFEMSHKFEVIGWRTMLINAHRLFVDSNKLELIFLTMEDITERKRTETALKESEEKYRLLITQMNQGIAVHEVIFDEAGKVISLRFLDANKSFERLTGLKHKNITGRTIFEIMPEPESFWMEKLGNVAKTGKPFKYESYSEKSGKYFETAAYAPRHNEVAVIISDVTEHKGLEIALAQEKKLLETTMISVGDGVISTDKKGNIVFMNRVAEFLTGWTQEAARGKSIREVFNLVNEFTREKSENIVKRVIESRKILEISKHTLLISKDGVERPIEDSAAPIVQENGETVGVVLVFRDFSEKKQKQERIEFLSYHDQLTGLYNRRFYEEELGRLDTERNFPIALVMADVNGLKLTNDAFGHQAGDLLLEKATHILKNECRCDEIIARIGGDEFVILLPSTDSKAAMKLVERINLAIANEKTEHGILSMAIGFAVKQDMSVDMKEVFKQAEDNMYRHKLSESSSFRSKTIDLIMNSLFQKNNREMLHSKRVSEICENIAHKLKFTKDDINKMRLVGLMHDIGKISIDESILNKKGKLNNDQWHEIMKHSEIGYRILSSVNEYSEIADYVLEHHERWDGKGYPKGLKGEEISIEARIIAVADSYDAMTSDRSYRKALSEEDALKEIRENAGIQFDPNISKIFV